MLESLTQLKSAVETWTRDLEDRLRLRMKNDQLMILERIFLLPEGRPAWKNYRHALISPSRFNSQSGSVEMLEMEILMMSSSSVLPLAPPSQVSLIY